MSGARTLVAALRDSEAAAPRDWTALIAAARAEQLAGTLAERLAERADLPPAVRRILDGHRADAARSRVQALWEAEMARRALAPLGIKMVLLKGTAFHAAGLDAARGRSVGDLDILVARESLDAAEAALVGAGWERLKPEGGYDDLYYRRWMHELPPLIHRERDRMIDVHHTILPPTARRRPDAAAMLADSTLLDSGLWVPAPEDMVCHAAAHLFADGDLAGGLRNLWDVDRLLRQFGADAAFWPRLGARAARHQLEAPVALALRLARRLYATPVDPALAGRARPADRLFEARLLARDGWGRARRPALRFAFYLRSHWMRMPPLMLARHLLAKARA
jgi:hypothetical protein